MSGISSTLPGTHRLVFWFLSSESLDISSYFCKQLPQLHWVYGRSYFFNTHYQMTIGLNCNTISITSWSVPGTDPLVFQRIPLKALIYQDSCTNNFRNFTGVTRYGRYSAGTPWAINKVCTHSLMIAAQRAKKLIDDHMVKTVISAELPWRIWPHYMMFCGHQLNKKRQS